MTIISKVCDTYITSIIKTSSFSLQKCNDNAKISLGTVDLCLIIQLRDKITLIKAKMV